MTDNFKYKILGHNMNEVSSVIVGINHNEEHIGVKSMGDENPQEIVNIVDFCLFLLDKDGMITTPKEAFVYFNNPKIYDPKKKQTVAQFISEPDEIKRINLYRPLDRYQFHINLKALHEKISKILIIATVYQPNPEEAISTITLKEIQPVEIWVNNKSSRTKDLLSHNKLTSQFINENCAIIGEIDITNYPTVRYNTTPRGYIVSLAEMVSIFTRKVND